MSKNEKRYITKIINSVKDIKILSNLEMKGLNAI